MSEEGVIDILTPASVQTRQFSERRKGYDPQEVDEFLDEVTHTLTDLGGRLDAAAAHVQRVEGELAELRAEREQALAAPPAADPGEVAALTAQIGSLQEQMQALVEQARVAEEARAAAAAGYEESSSRASALAEQIEAARGAHLRQQSTITALTAEVDYWKSELEAAREAAKPPMELSNALEVLAAAQQTAERMRLEAEQEAEGIRAQVNAEAARLRLDFERLRDVESGLRADVAALAYGVLDWVSGDDLALLPPVEQFDVSQTTEVASLEAVVDGVDVAEVPAVDAGAWAAVESPDLVDGAAPTEGSAVSGFDAWAAPAESPVVDGVGQGSFDGWSAPAPADDADASPGSEGFVSVEEALVVDTAGQDGWASPAPEQASDESASQEWVSTEQVASPSGDEWSAAESSSWGAAPAATDEAQASEGFGSWGAPEPQQQEGSWGTQETSDDPYGFNN